MVAESSSEGAQVGLTGHLDQPSAKPLVNHRKSIGSGSCASDELALKTKTLCIDGNQHTSETSQQITASTPPLVVSTTMGERRHNNLGNHVPA